MDYQNFLPSEYQNALQKLRENLINSTTEEEQKVIFDLFAEKYTVLPHFWVERIRLEGFHDQFSKEVYLSRLKLENLAMQHFYYPQYIFNFPKKIDEMYKIMNMGNFNFCYRLPEVTSLDSYCITSAKNIHFVLQYQRLENFLIFPHSQLRSFYRYHQLHCVTPLSDVIKRKYDAAIKSYNYMVTISMEPEKWLKWMKKSFKKFNWIQNLEAKLSEHWFMRPIWDFYINLLDDKNDVKVLNVYKRYCRFFISDKEMQEKYALKTLKYLKLGFDVSKWLFDQAKFEYDFGSEELGEKQIKAMLEKFNVCETCFDLSNEKYFNYELFFRDEDDDEEEAQKTTSWFSGFLFCKRKEVDEDNCECCCLCIDDGEDKRFMFRYNDIIDREIFFDSLHNTKSITNRNFNPIIKLQFRDTQNPPIPFTILKYIIENSNHDNILAKLYQTCKYFFVKKLILLCHHLYVSKTFEETFVKNSCATNFSTLINHSFIEKFCCKTLIFHDWEIRTYLSASLSKICFCSIEAIQIGGQDLTMQEFLMIIENGKLEQVRLRDVRIFKDDENILVIEEIVELLPTAVDVAFNQVFPEMYTPETAQNLAFLDRSMIKFESFELAQIPQNFDISMFGLFLKANMIPKAFITLRLQQNIGEIFRNEFQHFCETIKLDWDPIYEAPRINLI